MKFCNKCWTNKKDSDFWIRKKNKDGLQSACKKCQSLYHKERYKSLPHDIKRKKIDVANSRINELRKFTADYRLSRWCVDCWYKAHLAPLQFDHQWNKEYNISDMVKWWFSLEKIIIEIEKCEVVCANCHSIRTSKQQSWHSIK